MNVDQSQLATHIIHKMSYSELLESAIVGLTLFYHADPDKFQEDLKNEGLEEKA